MSQPTPSVNDGKDPRHGRDERISSAVFGGLAVLAVLMLPNLLHRPIDSVEQEQAIDAFALALPLLGVSAFIESIRFWASTEDGRVINITQYGSLIATVIAIGAAFRYFAPSAVILFVLSTVVAVAVGLTVSNRLSGAR